MDWLSIKENLKDLVKTGAIIAVIFFIIFYVFSITQVVGNSMNSTLTNGDVLILNKFVYRFKTPERGDIIVVRYSDSQTLIKRVIGLPGDTVSIKNNQVYINGELLEEDYLDDDLVYDDFELSSIGYTIIPDGYYFVLGDNRTGDNSIDSRSLGLFSEDDIVGKISLRIFPLNEIKWF